MDANDKSTAEKLTGKKSEDIVADCALKMSATGMRQLQADRALASEANRCIDYMLDGKPADASDKHVAIMGFALGLGFAESNAGIEKAGGFTSLLDTLINDGFEAVQARLKESKTQ